MASENERRNRQRRNSKRRRKRVIRAYLMRLLGLLILVAVFAGLFFGGRFIYSKASGVISASSQKELGDSIEIDKKGRVTGLIYEEFDESLYDSDELSSMLNQEIADYNRSVDNEEAVTLKKFSVDEGWVTVCLNYAGAEDYRGFNGVKLYLGSVSDLLGQAVLFDKDLIPVDNEESLVKAGEISALGSLNAIVLNEKNIAVKVPGSVLYASEGVELVGKKSVKVSDSTEGTSYIIYNK